MRIEKQTSPPSGRAVARPYEIDVVGPSRNMSMRLRLATRNPIGVVAHNSRHTDFARSILARYGLVSGRPGWGERILRRVAFGVVMQPIIQRSEFRFAPRFSLHQTTLPVVVRHETNPVTVITRVVLPTETLESVRTRREMQTVVRQRLQRTETLYRRLAQRGQRIEPGRPAARPPSLFSGDVGPMVYTGYTQSPVPREVVRNTPPQTEKTPETPIGEVRRPAAPADITPQVDVNRLTEDVIRAIDQRIIARRERMGRG